MGKDKRQGDRRGCDPDKCSSVLIERRKTENERRKTEAAEKKAYESEVLRKYYEEESRLMQEAIQEWVTKVMNASKKPHPVWDEIK